MAQGIGGHVQVRGKRVLGSDEQFISPQRIVDSPCRVPGMG